MPKLISSLLLPLFSPFIFYPVFKDNGNHVGDLAFIYLQFGVLRFNCITVSLKDLHSDGHATHSKGRRESRWKFVCKLCHFKWWQYRDVPSCRRSQILSVVCIQNPRNETTHHLGKLRLTRYNSCWETQRRHTLTRIQRFLDLFVGCVGSFKKQDWGETSMLFINPRTATCVWAVGFRQWWCPPPGLKTMTHALALQSILSHCLDSSSVCAAVCVCESFTLVLDTHRFVVGVGS